MPCVVSPTVRTTSSQFVSSGTATRRMTMLEPLPCHESVSSTIGLPNVVRVRPCRANGQQGHACDELLCDAVRIDCRSDDARRLAVDDSACHLLTNRRNAVNGRHWGPVVLIPFD